MSCFCGLPASFETCCDRYISGDEVPPTAEALMRSRYSAYVTGAVPYIVQTTHPSKRASIDMPDIYEWLLEITSWDGLDVQSTHQGLESDDVGTVKFVAHFHENHEPQVIQENSKFVKVNGFWMYYPS